MKLTGSKVVEDVEEGIELQVTLPAEMADAFQPIVAEMLSAKEHDGIEEVEQAAAGILAICGTMPFDELIRQLARLFPDKSEGWLRLNMKRKYLFKGQSPREAPRTPFAATPFLGDSAHQIFFLRSAGEQQEADRQVVEVRLLVSGGTNLPRTVGCAVLHEVADLQQVTGLSVDRTNELLHECGSVILLLSIVGEVRQY